MVFKQTVRRRQSVFNLVVDFNFSLASIQCIPVSHPTALWQHTSPECTDSHSSSHRGSHIQGLLRKLTRLFITKNAILPVKASPWATRVSTPLYVATFLLIKVLWKRYRRGSSIQFHVHSLKHFSCKDSTLKAGCYHAVYSIISTRVFAGTVTFYQTHTFLRVAWWDHLTWRYSNNEHKETNIRKWK